MWGDSSNTSSSKEIFRSPSSHLTSRCCDIPVLTLDPSCTGSTALPSRSQASKTRSVPKLPIESAGYPSRAEKASLGWRDVRLTHSSSTYPSVGNAHVASRIARPRFSLLFCRTSSPFWIPTIPTFVYLSKLLDPRLPALLSLFRRRQKEILEEGTLRSQLLAAPTC